MKKDYWVINLSLVCLLNRTIGVGFASLCARIGGMAAPFFAVRRQFLID